MRERKGPELDVEPKDKVPGERLSRREKFYLRARQTTMFDLEDVKGTGARLRSDGHWR